MAGLAHAGIEALGLGDEVDAGNAQPHHLVLDGGRQFPLDPHEALVAGQAIAQPFFVEIGQDGAQFAHRFIHIDDPARLGEEGRHADVHGHFETVAIEDRRPGRGDDVARLAFDGLIGFHEAQLHEAPADH